MPEMILPGTYIEVRAEGLIRPGPVSTGNIGIVGTARRGLLAADAVYTPADIGEAREIFGRADPLGSPVEPGNPLTLIRAMELAFANGAARVFAVRVAAAGAAQATYALASGGNPLVFTARAPGQGYDGATISTGPHALELDITVGGPGGAGLETIGPLPVDDVTGFVDGINAGSTRFTAAAVGGPTAPIPMGTASPPSTPGVAAVARVLAVTAGAGSVDFTANTPGSGASTVNVAPGSAGNLCNVTIDPGGGGTQEIFTDAPRAANDFITTINGTNGAYNYAANSSTGGGSNLFTVADNGSGGADVADGGATASVSGADATAAVFSIAAGPGSIDLTATTPGTGPNAWTVDVNGRVDLTIDLDGAIETWRDVSTDPATFAAIVNGTDPDYDYRTRASTGRGSNLFSVSAVGAAAPVAGNAVAAATGGGTNGAAAGVNEYEDGLDALLTEDVQLVVLAGQGAPTMTAALQSHVENASSDVVKRERIGIIGGDPSAARTDLVAPAQDEGRLVFVGPGIRTTDVSGLEVTLPGTYTAAAVAGLISALDPHASPTNKGIKAAGLQTVFNGTELEQLVLGRVLALEVKQGAIKVVRGVTSSSNPAWAQVTTRRIVDFARNGTRAAADPFIGKLNNERVRGALKGSVNSLLADMVDREMLVEYQLDVSATRDQQIRGIAQVTMVLMPTFSIDYIRVVMYLQ